MDALYEGYRELVAQERAEVVIGLAGAGVRATFATKPMCRALTDADAMIAVCKARGTILSIACHLNWYNWYTNARQTMDDEAVGRLRSMVCHSPHSLSNLQSHMPPCFGSLPGCRPRGWWVRWHPSQKLEELRDGRVRLRLRAGVFYEIKSWVLSFGAAAQVLELEELRDGVRCERYDLRCRST